MLRSFMCIYVSTCLCSVTLGRLLVSNAYIYIHWCIHETHMFDQILYILVIINHNLEAFFSGATLVHGSSLKTGRPNSKSGLHDLFFWVIFWIPSSTSLQPMLSDDPSNCIYIHTLLFKTHTHSNLMFSSGRHYGIN